MAGSLHAHDQSVVTQLRTDCDHTQCVELRVLWLMVDVTTITRLCPQNKNASISANIHTGSHHACLE